MEMGMFIYKSIRPTLVFKSLGFFLVSVFLLSTVSKVANADTCKEATKQLRGSFERSQGMIGGLWGYMEKSSALKKDSTLGFQIDGKLQRLVVGFESFCNDGKSPTKETYDLIDARLGEARMITNKTPGRTSPKKIMEMINSLNKNLDQTLDKLKF